MSGLPARTVVLLSAMFFLFAGAWVYLSFPADAVSTLNLAPGSPAEARQQEILRDNLDKPTDVVLTQYFNDLNTKYFSGSLPAMPVRWEPRLAEIGTLSGREFTLEGMFGRVGKRTVILLHPNLQADVEALDRALAHEMVHARLFFQGDTSTNHGPAFQAELKRLADAGAFTAIHATDAERTQLRAWLDAEGTRINSERDALAALRPELDRERASAEQAVDDAAGRREAYNLRAQAANSRTQAFNESLLAFNKQVKRYNLMIAYPDGLDEGAAPVALQHPSGKSH